MQACKVPEVPLHKGEEPFGKGKEVTEYFYGPDGLGGTLLEYIEQHKEIEPTNIKEEPAVDFLIRIARDHPGEITIIATAPLTNIAYA
jgi:purine nucleosidase